VIHRVISHQGHHTVVPAVSGKYTCRCGKSYSVLSTTKFQRHARQCPLPGTSIERSPEDGETDVFGNYLHIESHLSPMLLKHSLCCWIDNAVNFTELVPTEIPTEIPTEMSTVISLFMSATDGILEANDHSLQAGVRSISWFFEHMHWDKWIDEATSDNRSIGFKCVQYPKTEDHVMLRIALAVHAIFDDYQTRLLDISYLIRRKVMASK
jgi:hypothetical protein